MPRPEPRLTTLERLELIAITAMAAIAIAVALIEPARWAIGAVAAWVGG